MVNKKFKSYDRKESTLVLDEIQGRMMRGELFSVQDIVEQYFKVNERDVINVILTKKKAMGILSVTLRKRFLKEKLNYGCVNSLGQYGLIITASQLSHIKTFYYKKVKGMTNNIKQTVAYGVRDNLISAPQTEMLRIPKPDEE